MLKKSVATLFVTLVYALSSYSANHIQFCGLELSGSIDKFKDSLVSRGFEYCGSYKTMYNFVGMFEGEVVALSVVGSIKTKEVFKIVVLFPRKCDWRSLRFDYAQKVRKYSENYPIDKDYEFFVSPYDDGDGYEMKAVAEDKCRYVSFFFAMGGYISVEIDKSAAVKVTYEDRENIKSAKREIQQYLPAAGSGIQ